MNVQFGVGICPRVVLIDKTVKYPAGNLAAMARALKAYSAELAKHWGVSCSNIIHANSAKAGDWAIVFLDDPDSPGAFGYHDLTKYGQPLVKVFTKVCYKNKEPVSITASHELAEMLVDPACNLYATNPKGIAYALEACDFVEETWREIRGHPGFPMSNFSFPSAFEGFRKAGSMQFDWLGKCRKPFQLLKGGYAIIIKGGREMEIYGSKAKERRFKKEDRRGHRSETRKRGKLKKSTR
jgi:hypothetical protein